MWSWIVVAALYVIGMGLFHMLGGLASAAEALRAWGEAASRSRGRVASSA